MDSLDSILLSEFRKKVTDDIASRKDQLVTSPALDHAESMRRIGLIKGLMEALAMIEGIRTDITRDTKPTPTEGKTNARRSYES